MHFLQCDIDISIKISLKLVPKGQINDIQTFFLDNGMVPVRREAIIWTNDG